MKKSAVARIPYLVSFFNGISQMSSRASVFFSTAASGMRLLPRRWTSGKPGWKLFLFLAAGGFISSCLTLHLLYGFPYNSGKQMVGVFIPPFLCTLYMILPAFISRMEPVGIIRTIALYGIQMLPFAPLLFQVFEPTPEDDFSRYVLYARNMVSHHTLWGGDRLYFPTAGLHYVTQPGYRYWVAAELLLFRNLNRITQFFNIGLYLSGISCFLQVIRHALVAPPLRKWLMLLVWLFTPYAVKNLLMGLPEWLTALLMMMSMYLYGVRKREGLAMFLLALIPFFRQNLLITSLLIAVWILMHSARKARLAACFFPALLLPVYHNLYYAHEWRFFVDIFQMPFLRYASNSGRPQGIDLQIIWINLLHYTGIDSGERIVFSWIAFFFISAAVYLYFICFKILSSRQQKVFFLLVTLSAVLPALILGTAYYPRFEFVNVVVMMVAFLLLHLSSGDEATLAAHRSVAQPEP